MTKGALGIFGLPPMSSQFQDVGRAPGATRCIKILKSAPDES